MQSTEVIKTIPCGTVTLAEKKGGKKEKKKECYCAIY
jgi:hypothetical protein